ncbi:MAG TPA: hypothetical protein VGF91_11520 [Solirubrobacteraceae bacterium]|jgi:uncharacterized BrkB/YihY/UPF0761 family membrane protein
MSSGLPRLRRTATRVERFYWGSGLCDDVPALAWYLVGACVPLMLGIAALAALVLGDGARAEQVATRLASVLPPGARDQVIELVLRTHRNSPLLLVIALMAAAATEATNLRGHLGFPIPGWVLSVGSAVLIAAICSALYRFATTRRIRWRAAVRGGIPAAVVLELTPLVAGYYARAVAGRTPVQVFLVLAGLLFTCYLVAQGLLIGAGLAAGREVTLDRAGERVALALGG